MRSASAPVVASSTLKSARSQVARFDVTLGLLIVDIQDQDLRGRRHEAPCELVASRRNSETFSREIRFFEMTRVPTGRRALSSAIDRQ